jgi:hypothetical protein
MEGGGWRYGGLGDWEEAAYSPKVTKKPLHSV